MDSGKMQSNNNDGDDLSFEALTFGGDNDTPRSPSNDAGDESPRGHYQNDEHHHHHLSDNKKHVGISSRKHDSDDRSNSNKGTSSIYITSTQQGDGYKIDVAMLLKRLEQFGVVKASYFKEKQNFGFVQFLDSHAVDLVVAACNKSGGGLDGMPIIVERASASGNNNDVDGAVSFGGTPFSPPNMSLPSTPVSSSGALSPNPSLLPPEKPDTILVLKNLPFALKQDELQEILMQMNTTAPQSINLHFDNNGVFRGMAFIKYRGLDDAIKVYDNLNGYDVHGRKVRVEYKRKNKQLQSQSYSDVPQEWMDEDDLRKLWEQVKDFSVNPNISEISFNSNLSTNQKKQVHQMAEKLKLAHFANGNGGSDSMTICLKKNPLIPSTSGGNISLSSVSGGGSSNNLASNSSGSSSNMLDSARAIDIKSGRRPRNNSDAAASTASSSLGRSPGNHNGGFGSMDKDNFRSPRVRSSSHADSHADWRSSATSPPVSNNLIPQPGTTPGGSVIPTIVPSRQPKGPDGSKGFNTEYRGMRKTTCAQSPPEVVSPIINCEV